jgi:hypothetical protein
MTRLSSVMDQLESAGWPPGILFHERRRLGFFVAEQVWPVVRALLGVDCVLDSGSAFAWSLKATGRVHLSRMASSGAGRMPSPVLILRYPKPKRGHRGPGSSAFRTVITRPPTRCVREETGRTPNFLRSPCCQRLDTPPNDATLDNGCMYVVPKSLTRTLNPTDSNHARIQSKRSCAGGRQDSFTGSCPTPCAGRFPDRVVR